MQVWIKKLLQVKKRQRKVRQESYLGDNLEGTGASKNQDYYHQDMSNIDLNERHTFTGMSASMLQPEKRHKQGRSIQIDRLDTINANSISEIRF